MTRTLIVIENTDRDRALLEKARTVALGEETDIVVVALATPNEYEDVASTLDEIGRIEHTSYDEDDVLDGVSGDTQDLASDVLGGTIEYDLRTLVEEKGSQASTIVEMAHEMDCNHIFLPGYRRSPTGKAVFGDRTQEVLLNFDGYVTVSMD
ncbi:universal stress protein [Haloarcula amylovorans]|uniref:universal stress protein n=1 Tax=Haloarcula amylovorans TaxID=2562280 RepID=UPI001076A15D|nr:universal stress protein [Halomicroarcula amylolytica]